MNSRINSIDYAKALAIILVVIGHIVSDTSLVAWIYSFHMPLFFILSGHTLVCTDRCTHFNFGGMFTYVSKKIYQIIIPFLLYGLIFGLPDLKSWLYILYGTGNSLKIGGSNPVLWFLPCYFVASSILYCIICIGNKLISTNYRAQVYKYLYYPIACFLAFAIGLLLQKIGKSLPIVNSLGFIFSLDVAFIGIGFMIIPICISLVTDIKVYNRTRSILPFLLLLLISLMTFHLNLPLSMDNTRHIDMRESIYGSFPLFVIISLVGSYSIIFFGRFLAVLTDKLCCSTSLYGGGQIYSQHIMLYWT